MQYFSTQLNRKKEEKYERKNAKRKEKQCEKDLKNRVEHTNLKNCELKCVFGAKMCEANDKMNAIYPCIGGNG